MGKSELMERLTFFLNDLLIFEVVLIILTYLYSFSGVCTVLNARTRKQLSVPAAVMPMLVLVFYTTIFIKLGLMLWFSWSGE